MLMLSNLNFKSPKSYIALLVVALLGVAVTVLVVDWFDNADLRDFAANSVSLANPDTTLSVFTATFITPTNTVLATFSPAPSVTSTKEQPTPIPRNTSTSAVLSPTVVEEKELLDGDAVVATSTALPTSTPLPSATAGATAIPTFTATSEPSSTATVPASPTAVPTWTPIVHVVERGDNPSVISALYGVSLDALLDANGMTGYEILSIGQEIMVPHPTSMPMVNGTPQPTPTFVLRTAKHIVVRGDILLWIARYYGSTVDDILKVNDLDDPERLSVGQELLIPLNMPTSTPVPTATPTHTATPGPAYLAPGLLSPPDETEFQGTRRPIMLSWSAVGELRDDEWYVLRLQYTADGDTEMFSAWTKATSWRVPASVYPSATDAAAHEFKWDVTVVRHGATDSEGNRQSVAVSFMSETRTFFWY